MSILEHVQLKNVFRYFEEISQIPHGSYHTEAIGAYLVQFAQDHGFWHKKDEAGNVIIVKEASKGYEASETVILQGHMDMVCEKEADAAVDMEKEGLKLYVEDGFLKAKGTTLGGDDGIALAYALAILDDDSLQCPRLEAVFTTNEEVGLLGAMALDASELKGRILLNIDSDLEGHFLTSCAGGLTARTHIPVSYRNMEGVGVLLTLCGLSGGHSGSEIDKEHANAVIELGRILSGLSGELSFGIAGLCGGLKDNAIPRKAEASLVASQKDIGRLKEAVGEITKCLQKEYALSEPDLTVEISILEEKTYDALDGDSMKRVLFYLRHVPNGVCHMSMALKGLVETSLNAGIMKLCQDGFFIESSVRSSVESRKQDLADQLKGLSEFLGGKTTLEGSYPAWEYCKESKLREKAADVWQKLYGTKPVFEAIHAGLECGIFYERIPNLEAISFGPDNFDIHTPKERLNIASAERVYRFLAELLRELK